MLILTLLAWAGAVWWCIAVAVFLVTFGGAVLQPRIQARRATRPDRPPVSAILPIKLLDPGFETSLASIFGQDYPEFEVLIGAAERDSPALDAAQTIRRAFPRRAGCILQSDATAAVSPKLNVMTAPLGVAAHDFVLTKDSNITLEPGIMAAFMQNFVAGVGLVVAIPIAVRPKTLAGRIEACLINGHARLLLAASTLGLGFGVGKVMLFRRSDLAKAGGIGVISYTIAEDSAISKAMAGQGLKTVFAHRTVEQEIGARSLREIYLRQVRWAVIRRAQEPVSYPLEPISSPLPAALAAALAAPLTGLPAWLTFAVTLLGWFAGEMAIAGLKGWEISAWSPLAFIGREILSLSAWLRAWIRQDVVWAEERFDVAEEERAAKPTLGA